jgi:nicotinate-nucleotide--dimethylbenzimidazole phosphoribosyltransferase
LKTLLDRTISQIGPLDHDAMQVAEARQNSLTKPAGSLGRLEALSIQLAGITGRPVPVFADKVVAVMAADHGVTAEGVSAYPAEVTPGMVANFAAGGAAINAIARHIGARVIVTDVGVNADISALEGVRHRKVRMGTANMALGPAMTRDEAVRAIEIGIEVVEEAVMEKAAAVAAGMAPALGAPGSVGDVAGPSTGARSMFATGEMGIGNTTASSAIIAALTGRAVAEVTGRGTGIAADALPRKIAVIEKALDVNQPDPGDPVGVLAKVGGLEIAALTGVILGAAAHRVPVVMDGFISSAAALAAVRLCRAAAPYILPSHVSVEVGHQVVLDELGLVPLFDLQMRLGEGTGAALAMSIIEAAAKTLAEMATFESANVANRSEGDSGPEAVGPTEREAGAAR